MNHISVILDGDETGKVFDEVLKKARAEKAQDTGDLHIFTKRHGTKEGNPIAAIVFTAVVNGKPQMVQTVTTVKLLVSTLEILKAKYPNL